MRKLCNRQKAGPRRHFLSTTGSGLPLAALGLAAIAMLSACLNTTVRNDKVVPALAITVMPEINIDGALLERRLVPYVNDLRVDHGVSIELCIYGHSRGRELFLYSGDEYAPVKNIGENMDIAVLVRIKKSGRTTRVLFVKASGEGEEQLFNNAAREIAIGLSAAGLGAGATTKP
jgi:hypothetical protein